MSVGKEAASRCGETGRLSTREQYVSEGSAGLAAGAAETSVESSGWRKSQPVLSSTALSLPSAAERQPP